MSPTPHDQLPAVIAAIDASHDALLADLFELLAQPSVSAQNLGIRETAAIEERLLQEAGLSTRIIETGGEPLVYGEWLGAPGKPTVLFYGHYDVQPPEPLELWESPPFEPVIRAGRIYARGVADNKAQHFSHIAAVKAWMATTGSLPVNVKVVLEGEEESGSPSFHDAVVANRDLLTADLMYASDGPVSDVRYPQITYGVRGMLYIELRAKGPNRDLHSGHWGGVSPNPIWMLVRALGTMVNEDNRVTIEGYYDHVVEPTPGARAAMDALPFDIPEILAGAGVAELPPPADLNYADRIMAQPTFNLSGLHGGYEGPGSKTIIPSTAVAKIDMRLVPNQTPDEIWDKVEAHMAMHAPDVEVVRLRGGVLPSYTPVEQPLAEPVRRAIAFGFGSRPIDIPMVGASRGDAVWTSTLGIPAFDVPYGAPEQANHSPNENYRLERLWQGIATSAALLAELAITPVGDSTR